MKRWKVYLADCEKMSWDVLPKVQAVITDPPYGFQGESDEGRRRMHGTRADSGKSKYGSFPTFAHRSGRFSGRFQGDCIKNRWVELDCADWNQEVPLEWIRKAYRVLIPGGAILSFTDSLRPHLIQEELESVGFKFLRLFYWIKTNPPTQPGKNFRNAVEVAVFARKPGPVHAWNGGGTTLNYHENQTVPWQQRIHKTQKPIELMSALIRTITNPGDIILDPFMGSATTGVSALRLNRRYIGIEKNPDNYRAGLARLKKHSR